MAVNFYVEFCSFDKALSIHPQDICVIDFTLYLCTLMKSCPYLLLSRRMPPSMPGSLTILVGELDSLNLEFDRS